MAQILGEDFILYSATNGARPPGGKPGFGPEQWEDRAACGMPDTYQEHGWHTDYPGASEVARPFIARRFPLTFA
jgi:hypothetical protein